MVLPSCIINDRNKMSLKRELDEDLFEEHWEPILKEEEPPADMKTEDRCGGQFISRKLLKKEELEHESDSGISEEYDSQPSTQFGHSQEMLCEKEIVWRFTEDSYSSCDPLSIKAELPDCVKCASDCDTKLVTLLPKEEPHEAPSEVSTIKDEERGNGNEAEGRGYKGFDTEVGKMSPSYWDAEDPPPEDYEAPLPNPTPNDNAAPPPSAPTPDGYRPSSLADRPPDGYADPPPTDSVPEGGVVPLPGSELRPYDCRVCKLSFSTRKKLRLHYKRESQKCTAQEKGLPAGPISKSIELHSSRG